jgi:glycosyltransferase involved in cell wall biosynthesis
MGPKRRFALRQFDAATARSVSKLPPGSVGILHIWNWVPKTVAAIRRLNPDAVVLRDVSIAREYDFELGEHITTEMKHVDLFVSPSRFATEQMLQWGVPESRIKEIPFGVDLEMFRPDGERPRNEARNVRYAYAGAVSARKGIPELLRAWQILDLEDAELHLYGTVKAEVRPYLEGASHVVAHGFTRIAEELPKNDVFVFPSHREGSSKAVYEALACGLPVITTPNAGSVVRDGVEGYVVPPGDEVALADAVRRLHEDGRKRVVMGRAARSRAEEFPWSRYARDVWALYEQTTMHQGES